MSEWFLDEAISFPASVHDDGIDALSQGLAALREPAFEGMPFAVLRQSPPGWPEPPAPRISVAVGQKIISGIPLSDADENELLFSGLDEL